MQNSVLSSSPQYPNAQPFFGVVENTVQALRLVHAARLGVIPRVLRRLNNSERRRMIVSGAVFVFSVEESGIKRWTDGLLFSPSRIDGNFLVYKELNERTTGSRQSDRSEGWIYMSGEGGRDVYPSVHEHGGQYRTKISFAAESDASTGGLKIGGLVKKTITVKIHGSDYHLVSYYTQQDLDSERFIPMSSRPDIMNLDLPPQIFTFSDYRTPPRVETAKDGRYRIVCEPETQDSEFGGEDIRGYRTRLPGRQMNVERDTARSSSILDSTVIASSASRNQGAASSSDQGFIHNRQEQLAQMIPRYPFQQAGYPPQSTSLEGHGGNNQDDLRTSSVGYGSLPQYQSERLASPQPYPAHYASSSSAPNTYFSTSQLRGERDQSNEQTFEARQAEQLSYGYSRANVWPSAVNQHSPSSEGPPLSPTFPSPHQWSAGPWASANENNFAQPRPPELDNLAAQSRSMGQRFIPGPQLYTVDPRNNEQQYEDDER